MHNCKINTVFVLYFIIFSAFNSLQRDCFYLRHDVLHLCVSNLVDSMFGLRVFTTSQRLMALHPWSRAHSCVC